MSHDWADRFPAIVNAALRLNAQAFLVDEAVIGRAINTATRWRLDREARRGRSRAQRHNRPSDTVASTASHAESLGELTLKLKSPVRSSVNLRGLAAPSARPTSTSTAAVGELPGG
jgi:hypothetical protein